MATTPYEDALCRVRSFSREDQERLLTDLAGGLQSSTEETTSILELQGLGKEVWAGVDAQKYLDQERASWNG